jgi:hypothetical protein
MIEGSSSSMVWEFSLHHRVQPPIQWVPGPISLKVKRPGRENNHSPPSSTEVKECVELYLHSPDVEIVPYENRTRSPSPFTYIKPPNVMVSLQRPLWTDHSCGVSTVTRLRAGRPGIDSRKERKRKLFSSPPRPDRSWGPCSFLSNG